MSGKDDVNIDEITNYGYDQRINICMIGPSGVGKTSLLATMYKTTQRNLGKKFRFEPINKKTVLSLNEKYTSLQKMVEKPTHTRVVNTDKGTDEITEYLFGLDYVADDGAKKKLLLVCFFDTPGAMTSEMSEDLEKRISESQIIINAIDSGVMMKVDVLNAERYNGYAMVERLLEDKAFADAKNKLIIFALIKAETWISEQDNPKHVAADVDYFLRKFEEQCQCLVDLFPPLASRLGIFCPVETLGCVEFSMVTRNEADEQCVHYKRVFGKKFAPRHVQLPLYFALRFAVSEWCNNKGFFSRLVSKWFGSYKEVLAALEEMDAEVLQNLDAVTVEPGFYGNLELLTVKNT